MEDYKVVNTHIYTPHDAIFRGMRNDRAECKTVRCSNSENCGLFARGECAWLGGFGWQACPYGKFNQKEGFTKKARAYFKWIKEKKDLAGDTLDKLSSHKNVMAIVGEYIFLPYAHITMNDKIPFLAKGGLFNKENCFLKYENFTIDNIISICEFRPYAMMGGEILSYQKEVVPNFIKHLSEILPKTYQQLCLVFERAKSIVDSYSHIGRKALLETITPNAGRLIDCHKSEWVWDGEYLTSNKCRASFMLISDYSELRLKPNKGCVVEISDNSQVNENTKFLS